jgi:hypothetical protein
MNRVSSACWGMQGEWRAEEALTVVVEPEAQGLGKSAGSPRDHFVLRIGG